MLENKKVNKYKSNAVLGLNLGHDSSACLVIDGQVRVAIAEERLSRLKHHLPLNKNQEYLCKCPLAAIQYCIDIGGIALDDIDLVVASTTYVLNAKTKQRRALEAKDVVAQCKGLSLDRVRITTHHFSHAVSSAWCSGYEEAAVIVVDGGGSIAEYGVGKIPTAFERTTLYHWDKQNLKLIRRSTGSPPDYGHSLGDFYQLITEYLGFRAGEEGKTMGLSAYGRSQNFNQKEDRASENWKPLLPFETAISVDKDGKHSVSHAFQFTDSGEFPKQLIEWFGSPRKKSQPHNSLDRHIAASAQWALEKAMLEITNAAHRLTGSTQLCMAGGVALNCVANGRILQEGPFSNLFVQPAASDDGTAIGNALLAWKLSTGQLPKWQFQSPYLGKKYSLSEVSSALQKFEQKIFIRHPVNLALDFANSVARGLIVGLFRGGSEFGPRALGHRSIICDPQVPTMKDHLNLRVKHREDFRPFAPIVLEERVSKYFDLDKASPYMLLAARVLRPESVPAISHFDGTARVQTVNDQQEPFLCDVLRAFEARTGVSVLLNTSFNVAGEPIVESPEDALRCFLGTGIDVLYIENVCVYKDAQLFS